MCKGSKFVSFVEEFCYLFHKFRSRLFIYYCIFERFASFRLEYFSSYQKAKQATWINPIVGVLISLSMAFQPRSFRFRFLCSIAGRHSTATTIRLCSSVCTRVTFGSLKRAPTNHSLVD
eukprot:sb/3476305/